jgi:hypothetical protein
MLMKKYLDPDSLPSIFLPIFLRKARVYSAVQRGLPPIFLGKAGIYSAMQRGLRLIMIITSGCICIYILCIYR